MNTKSLTSCRRLFTSGRQILKAHPLACLSLGLTLLFATVTLAVRAQQSATTADQLELAVQLLDKGETRLAQNLFANVAPNDPAYAIAQAYDALCRYELCRSAGTNDYRWFFSALTSPALQQAELPRQLREDLAFTEIDARFQSRRFGSANTLRLVSAFKQEYSDSVRLDAMADYELAAWFERGMQSLYKASFDETRCFHEPWTNGLAQLEQFVSLAGRFKADNYTVLQDR